MQQFFVRLFRFWISSPDSSYYFNQESQGLPTSASLETILKQLTVVNRECAIREGRLTAEAWSLQQWLNGQETGNVLMKQEKLEADGGGDDGDDLMTIDQGPAS